MTSLNDETFPGPDLVFEWMQEVIRTAARRLGGPPESTGVVTEEHRHHASWKWPDTGRAVTLVETVPGGRQILSVRSAGTTAWYEGRALRRFPRLEDMILRSLGLPSVRPGSPDSPGYPPLP
jgi:hypothetical protein